MIGIRHILCSVQLSGMLCEKCILKKNEVKSIGKSQRKLISCTCLIDKKSCKKIKITYFVESILKESPFGRKVKVVNSVTFFCLTEQG